MLDSYLNGIRRVVRSPSARNLAKASAVVRRHAATLGQRLADHRHGSYCTSASFPRVTGRFLSPIAAGALEQSREKFALLAARYLEHRFDLLGSGWVQVRHGMQGAGIEGHRFRPGASVIPDRQGWWLARRLNEANLPQARALWSVTDAGYVPIDWQLDFKSGYRWLERTWYMDIPWGHRPGADIKLPWELGRMQHLAHLGWAFALSAARPDASSVYAREFRNQVLDFIASNPPRFGVNWRCAMEVAIRVANWLIAHDIFTAYGARFDAAFEEYFSRSVYEHARHIADNLEGAPGLRGNHYLAGIAGLLFAAAYLDASPETDRWLNFAIAQLGIQIETQFTGDGANFEASTSYHRLAAEIALYAAALASRLGRDRARVTSSGLAPEHFARIEKMAEFAIDITKPNRAVVQIGDNDSGRFLKLDPAYDRINAAGAGTCENHLDHRHLVSAASGLFARPAFARFAEGFLIDAEVVRTLSGGARQNSRQQRESGPIAATARLEDGSRLRNLSADIEALQADRRRVYEFAFPGGHLGKGLILSAYPGFGLYIFRSSRIYLAVRCGRVDTRMGAGHAHNDQLCVELNVDGRDIVVDPGSFVYSGLPARRDEYRASAAHFVPRIDGDSEGVGDGMFVLSAPPEGKCLYFGADGFAGTMVSRCGHELGRMVRFEDDRIVITDWCKSAALVPPLPAGPRLRFSPGYGILSA